MHVRHLMPFILVRLQERQEGFDRLQLKAGINGAEPWTDEMRRKIEELLNVNSFDIYGLCEITGPVLHLTAFITKVCMCKRIISIRKS